MENHRDSPLDGGGGSGDGVFLLHLACPLFMLHVTSEEHLKNTEIIIVKQEIRNLRQHVASN